jgi:hypothetical protein
MRRNALRLLAPYVFCLMKSSQGGLVLGALPMHLRARQLAASKQKWLPTSNDLKFMIKY